MNNTIGKMTIRMSSALLGSSSLDSSSSFVEIDSDNTTSRSSSHEALDEDRPRTNNNVANVPSVIAVNSCGGVDSSDDIDTKPNVSEFMAQSGHFLKNNFAAMGGGLGSHPHSHHHHHHSYPGLSAALQSYHQHHQQQTSQSAVSSSSITSPGVGGGPSIRSVGMPFGGPTSGSHGGHHGHAGPAKPPFMQLYKSLFANAVLQNPDKMSSTGFARNVLFTCGSGSERSPPDSDGEVDEKGSLADEVGKMER